MKATLANTLLYLLFVSASAQKERLGSYQGGSVQGPSENGDHSDADNVVDESREHFAPPSELDHTYDENIGNERNTINGRTETSSCGGGDSIHHQAPCDDNVVSKGINNSDSISTRYDPVEESPSNESFNETSDVSSVTEATETIESQTNGNIELSSSDDSTANTPCVSSDGTFGDISDDALMAVPITYLYEIDTVAGTDPSKIDNEILPRLEKAIVDSILQEVFPERCASTAIGKRNRKRKLRIQRRLEVIGVSMYPPDYVTINSCNTHNSSDSTSDCVVAYGELTLFVDEEQAVQEQPRIENLIKENMNSGIYDDASEEIVRLHYLESSSDPMESNIGDGSDGTGRKSQNSLRMGLFIGLGALVAVLAGVVFRTSRRMRNSDDQSDMQSGDGRQTYLDVDAQQQQSLSFS